MKKTIALLMALVMVLCLLPSMTLAVPAGWSTTKPSGSVVSLYGTPENAIKSGPLYKTKLYYQVSPEKNTNNYSFAIPAFADFFELNPGWTIDYVNVAANSSGQKQPGSSILLSSSGGSLVYYFKRTQSQTQTITLTYNANGGSGAPAAQMKDSTNGKASFTISNQIPSRQNYDFAGWSTDQNATSAMYQPNANIEISQDTTLYAVWNNHEHKDANNDGFCDTDRTCMHDHDNDGYCTEDNCTHPDTCCPKRNEDDNKPKPENTPTIDPNMNSIVGMDNIKVKCTTDTTNHAEKTYGLIDNGFEVSSSNTWEENVGYTRNITLKKDVYLAKYNADYPNTNHTLSDNDPISIKIVWDNSSAIWKPIAKVDVTINVKCETPEPTPPAKPTDNDVPDIIGREAVKVHCINDYYGSDDKSYGIFNGSFSIGDVILKGDVYTCDITVYPKLYVAEYVKDLETPHTLSPAGQTGTITLIYYAENKVWGLMPNYDLPIVFNVTCSDEDETFTVTYLDGFSGTYATYTNLKYGDATPEPANPYRSGYIFLGWEPSVEPTVTGNAEYVAQWGYIGPQYPNPTPVQPVQPGILPPQTGDMPLWYAIARFLGLVK